MSLQTYKTLNDVIALAEFAHRNQQDKAGMPYIEHPRRVMQSVQAQGAMPYVQMAAILHDVTEDTSFTPQILRDLGVPDAAVRLVELLDRNRSKLIYENTGDTRLDIVYNDQTAEFVMNMSKDEYYYACIKDNPDALMIKLADIGDNLQPWRLNYLPKETQERLREKYRKAYRLLGVNW